MGYWGTMVFARADQPLSLQAGAELGGMRRWLYEYGDGWQLLETHPYSFQNVVLAAAVAGLAASTGQPALAGAVNGGDCVRVVGAIPGGDPWTLHWPASQTERCGYDHESAVVTDDYPYPQMSILVGWARAAGFAAPSAGALRALLTVEDRSMRRPYYTYTAEEFMADLIQVLRPATPVRVPYRYDPLGWPFGMITDMSTGLGTFAGHRRAIQQSLSGDPAYGWFKGADYYRDHPLPGDYLDERLPEGWVDEALSLQDGIWDGAYNPRADPEELLRHTVTLVAAKLGDPVEEYVDVPLPRHDNQPQPPIGYFPTNPEGRLPGGRRA